LIPLFGPARLSAHCRRLVSARREGADGTRNRIRVFSHALSQLGKNAQSGLKRKTTVTNRNRIMVLQLGRAARLKVGRGIARTSAPY
jgi:hypothetical protein